MTSVSGTSWLSTAPARPAVAPARPRHLAPGSDTTTEYPAESAAPARPGRHAEPEWFRQLFDPRRDEDALEWLGFIAGRD